MNTTQQTLAKQCLESAESNTMTFPQIVMALMEAGFEGYFADLRRATITYYLPNGENIEYPMAVTASIAADFNASDILQAIKEAQMQVPGYTYKGFCIKAAAAGCAGYMVSFSGRRAVYFGRTAETHVEHFPSVQ